jgi:hypothetical protein
MASSSSAQNLTAGWTTICHGFKFRINSHAPITTRTIADICDSLSTAFTALYKSDCLMAPDPCNEGGIRFVKWPGMGNNAYKSIRFVEDNYHEHWPKVDDSTLQRWRTEEPVTIFSTPTKWTWLKAQNTAGWKLKEVRQVAAIFEMHDLQVLKSTIPTQKKMSGKDE